MNREPLWQNPSAQMTARVYASYQALVDCAPDVEQGMGGTFVFCGLLDAAGRESVMAANIAGAASLALSADADSLRQALRDGVLDFAVNSLDEALRILKNELRKRQAVSVGVDGDVAAVMAEMLARGVQPALLSASSQSWNQHCGALKELERRGAVPVSEVVHQESVFVWWAAPTVWMPKIDLLAANLLPEGDVLRKRWLQLSARNLSREARGMRFLTMTEDETARFQSAIGQAVEEGAISARVDLYRMGSSEEQVLNFAPQTH